MLGDPRWAGAFGIHADFVAVDNCFLTCIATADIMVNLIPYSVLLDLINYLSQEALRKPALYRIREIFRKAEYIPNKEDNLNEIPSDSQIKV